MKKRKKSIIGLLMVALTVAATYAGVTLAFLSDANENVKVMTRGRVKINQLEYERVDTETKDEEAKVQEFQNTKLLLPCSAARDFLWNTDECYVDWTQIGKDGYSSGIWNPDKIQDEVDKMVFVKNTGNCDACVRSVFAFEAGKCETLDEFMSMVHLNINTVDWTWEWVPTAVTIDESRYYVAAATYKEKLLPGNLTEISLSQIALDRSVGNEDLEAIGDTYQFMVKSQAVQPDGFADCDTTLNEAFGVISADNIPWETNSPTRDTDLKGRSASSGGR